MGYVLKFIAVLAAFVIAVSAVVWTTAGAERTAAGRMSREIQTADDMMVALIARESAFRGYAQSARMAMLEPYDEAAANLAGAADLAREDAGGGRVPEQLAGLRWPDREQVAPLVLAEPPARHARGVGGDGQGGARPAGEAHLGCRDGKAAVGEVVACEDAALADLAQHELAGASLGDEVHGRRRALVAVHQELPIQGAPEPT
jgi:hypothetical protein